jgi:hypothetical protein
MHEIRATLPSDCVPEAARLALAAGIDEVTLTEVFVHGPNAPRRLLSVETSTPKAKAFVDALLQSKVLSDINYTLTSREVRAIISDAPLESLTRPMSEPFPDIVQDLWQLSHVTASYVGRCRRRHFARDGHSRRRSHCHCSGSPFPTLPFSGPGGQLRDLDSRPPPDVSGTPRIVGQHRAGIGPRSGRGLVRRWPHSLRIVQKPVE